MDLDKLFGRYRFVWNRQYRRFKGEAPWSGARQNILKSLFFKYNIKDGLALDLGCGYGDKSFFLEKLGFKVFAVDISSVAIREAVKKTSKVSFICADIRDLNKVYLLRNKRFDVTLDLFTSHFLNSTQMRSYIKEIYKLSKPGGYLIMNVYAKDSETPSNIARSLSPNEVGELYSEYFKVLERLRNKFKYAKGNYTDLYVLRRNQ
ncbi:class I SAM-dependent methyltransferase [bacterium]|nr:class I SAM-dependent methyltransferase [bacterium]